MFRKIVKNFGPEWGAAVIWENYKNELIAKYKGRG